MPQTNNTGAEEVIKLVKTWYEIVYSRSFLLQRNNRHTDTTNKAH